MDFKKLDWRLIYDCAIASDESYGNSTIKVGTDSLLIVEVGDKKIVAFAGSKDFQDWMNNFEFVKVKRDDLGWIHNGFADSFDNLKKPLLVHPKINKFDNLIFTGHSLGGAVAQIMALHFQKLGYNVVGCYTFGQPRVGNSDWKKNYEMARIPTFRFVHGYDSVPNVPKIMFYHVGQIVPIFGDKILDKQMGSGWAYSLRIFKLALCALHHILAPKRLSDDCYINSIRFIRESLAS